MGRKFYSIFILLAVVALSLGCGSKKSGGGSGGGGDDFDFSDDIPPITDPDPSLTPEAGAVVNLIVTDKGALDSYVGKITNTPTDTQLVINLKKYATVAKSGGGFDYGFGGYVSIKFKDNGSTYKDVFSSLWMGNYPIWNTVASNEKNHVYNLLSNQYPGLNGQVGYHGFFEDTRPTRGTVPQKTIVGGAIILVIDSTIDLGDGAGPSGANGSVWFKNYVQQPGMGPLPFTSCWFIAAGPYDCRSWKANDKVATKTSIYPNNGYVKLGNFYNLNMQKAFNNQLTGL